MSELEDEIRRWVDEMQALLVSIKRIVEYFATDEEYDLLLRSLVVPEAFLNGVIPAFDNSQWRAAPTGVQPSRFTCGRAIAAMITPLLQIVVEPTPEFVPLARKELDPAHFSALLRHVGGFTGSIAVDLCETIWRNFNDLCPEGWPASLGGSRGSEGSRSDGDY